MVYKLNLQTKKQCRYVATSIALFGLLLAFPQLQGPIHHFPSLRLDFFPLSCTSQQKVDTTLYFYTSFNEHNTPYTVLESDNSESMPDVLH